MNNVNNYDVYDRNASRGKTVGYIIGGLVVLALLLWLLASWGDNDNDTIITERESIVSTVPAERDTGVTSTPSITGSNGVTTTVPITNPDGSAAVIETDGDSTTVTTPNANGTTATTTTTETD